MIYCMSRWHSDWRVIIYGCLPCMIICQSFMHLNVRENSATREKDSWGWFTFGKRFTFGKGYRESEQECIPVECIPPAAVAVQEGGLHQAPPRGPDPPGPGSPLGTRPPRTRQPPGDQTPPVDRMTDRCKHITLPQTSFAGGKNSLILAEL